MKDVDDKDLAIVTIGCIAIVALICFVISPLKIDPISIVTHTVTAIAGIATGRALTKASTEPEKPSANNPS